MNNINRQNYETFFLLYTDNELSVAEKKAVDEFVETNPDLQEELVMLQQSVLKPDNTVFDGKNSLLKHEFIPGHLQEKLLLYLDNELTAAERKEMAGLIKMDPAIKKEWEILQQIKLSPAETIVFKDKQSLYRNETGRVLAFPWQRLAVAAVFIGLIISGGLVYFNNGTKVAEGEIAVKTHTKPTPATSKPATRQTIAPIISSISKKEEVAVTRVNIKKPSTTDPIKLKEKSFPKRLTNRNSEPVARIEETNNLPEPYSENLNKIGSNKTIPAYVTSDKQPDRNKENGKSDDKKDDSNIYASTASYTDNNGENNNRVLFMNEEKLKKTKLGGIFRKVKRVLERSANIKSGDNNIKVANLEFAIQ